jgi:beta-aspartyl-peptidase (threonine type)
VTKHRAYAPALIVHGGAGGRALEHERADRRRGLLAAIAAGARILRDGGGALDAVVAAVVALEDHPLFNAGLGSFLTTEGKIEMDAAVTTAHQIMKSSHRNGAVAIAAGGVVLVRRVCNPILLARAVMERTPHMLMGGAGAERLARRAGIPLCRPETLITPRSRDRWLANSSAGKATRIADQHGTVGAAAVDGYGSVAAATSTGGVARKLPGRIGDSAILGAGLYAAQRGAASATGEGEAIMKAALCRTAFDDLRRNPPGEAAAMAIGRLHALTGGEAGIIMVDVRGRFGSAHNAAAMEIATFHPADGIHHRLVPALDRDT